MRFEIENPQEDGGGDLFAVAEDTNEVREFLDYFKPFPAKSDDPEDRIAGLRQEADALKAGHLEVRKPRHQSRFYDTPEAWYAVTGSLQGLCQRRYYPHKDWGFLDPYKECMLSHLGYDLPLPDMELTDKCDRRLCHTHIVQRMWISNDSLHFVVLIETGAWNNQTALEYAIFRGHDYVAESIGGRHHEPEFIPAGNLYKPNPNYATGRRIPPEPAFGAPWLWNALFDWWRDAQASPRQREILQACDELHKVSKLEPDYRPSYSGGMANFTATYSLHSPMYYSDPNGTIDWHGDKSIMASAVNWKDFANLK